MQYEQLVMSVGTCPAECLLVGKYCGRFGDTVTLFWVYFWNGGGAKMFLLRLLYLSVCLSVCLPACPWKFWYGQINFHEIQVQYSGV